MAKTKRNITPPPVASSWNEDEYENEDNAEYEDDDEDDVEYAFKPSKPPVLRLTPEGNIPGRERKEPRFRMGGAVFLHCFNNKTILAKARDLSQTGLGLKTQDNFKGCEVGESFVLEYLYPHKLHGISIKVELARVNVDQNGHKHLGFRLLDPNRVLKKRINELISVVAKADPWNY